MRTMSLTKMRLEAPGRPRPTRRAARPVAALLAALLVAAAHSSGCGESATSGGIGGSGAVAGPIEDFGSIFVGGIEFDTSAATITLDGELSEQSALSIGMPSRISGIVDTATEAGIAQNVEVETSVRGPLESLEPGSRRFVVLGQQIVLDSGSVLEDGPVAGLALGSIVSVGGLLAEDDSVRATLVQATPDADDFIIRGKVRRLDVSTNRFEIRRHRGDTVEAFVIHFKGAVIVGGELENAATVSVHTGASGSEDNNLVAQIVRVFPVLPPGESGDVILTDSLVFDVLEGDTLLMHGDLRVLLSPSTVFVGGTILDIAPGTRLRVQGSLDDDLALVASRVEFGPQPDAPPDRATR